MDTPVLHLAMVVLPQLKFRQAVVRRGLRRLAGKGIVSVHVVRGCTLRQRPWARQWPSLEGYRTRMSRFVDFAVGGFWLVARSSSSRASSSDLNLPQRDKHKADRLFYTGIVLIAVATPVLLCYLVVRVSRRAAARVAESATDVSDPGEWVSLLRASSCSREARATGRAFLVDDGAATGHADLPHALR